MLNFIIKIIDVMFLDNKLLKTIDLIGGEGLQVLLLVNDLIFILLDLKARFLMSYRWLLGATHTVDELIVTIKYNLSRDVI